MVDDDPARWSRVLLAVMSAGVGALVPLLMAASFLGVDPEDRIPLALLGVLALIAVTGAVAACVGRHVTWVAAIGMGSSLVVAVSSQVVVAINAYGWLASSDLPGIAIPIAAALLGVAAVVTASREWSHFRRSA